MAVCLDVAVVYDCCQTVVVFAHQGYRLKGVVVRDWERGLQVQVQVERHW